ncbi:MAG: HlyD family type I secretion periplasmic adaptor subunit [Afipia sp.]|nr:HlyD family type I secretion periplasmic adaptor subunit [Afipia sp.]
MKRSRALKKANDNVTPLRRTPRREEAAFLPAALEIVDTPASPVGRMLAASIAAFLLLAIGWSYFGKIDIVATAHGKVVPVGRVKVIQPLETGVVKAIHVKDGDRVGEGKVLIELDDVAALAERNRVGHDLLRARLDVARLNALRAALQTQDGKVEFVAPTGTPTYETARTRAATIAQAAQQAAKIATLDRQIAQKAAEEDSIAALIEKLNAGMPFIEEAAVMREKLMKMEFGNRIAHLEAQLKFSEQTHELIVQKNRAKELVAARQALEWQREQTKSEYENGIMKDLAEAEPKAAQFSEDMIKAQKRLNDLTLRAPIAGTIQQNVLHTIGGVVTPAQQLMLVVPIDSHVEIEVMLDNKDVGFVHEGDLAEVKVDTFNFTKYGLLHGKVVSVSQDAISRDKPSAQVATDRQQNQYGRTSEPPGQELLYATRISLDDTKIQVDDRFAELTPGMAVSAEIKTGQRRIIEYLLSPLLRYKSESLRER